MKNNNDIPYTNVALTPNYWISTIVHTIGLDAPILLLINMGFCRTPVGEGALVHNGRDSAGLFKAGWNSIGHVIKTSKDKVKKTLFTVTESKGNTLCICVSIIVAVFIHTATSLFKRQSRNWKSICDETRNEHAKRYQCYSQNRSNGFQ